MVTHWQEVHGGHNCVVSDGINYSSYTYHNVIVNSDNLYTHLLMLVDHARLS